MRVHVCLHVCMCVCVRACMCECDEVELLIYDLNSNCCKKEGRRGKHMNDQICSLLFTSFYHAQGGSELQWRFSPSSELNFVLLVQQKDDRRFECVFLKKWQQRRCRFIHTYLSASLHLAVWWQSQNLTP